MMEEIKTLKGRKIGFPLTPCRWIKEPEYEEITRLKITHGGGIGGAIYYEYVDRVDLVGVDTLQQFNRITGKTITINTRYIVSVENFTLVTAKYIHNNSNFRKTMGTPQSLQFLIEDGETVILVNDYKDRV